MRSLIIILSAIGAAILVMSFVKRWQIKQAKKTGKSPDKIENSYITGAIVAIIVFALGVIWLESDSAAPSSTYSPARIEDGRVMGGGFEKK